MKDLIKLGGLWKGTDKSGKTYLKGGLGYGANILVFPNAYKEGENDPDYIIYVAKKQKKEGEEKKVAAEDLPF